MGDTVRCWIGEDVNTHYVPLAGVPVGHSFARKFPREGNSVFKFGDMRQPIETVPKFVMAPRTGYGMWVEGGLEPQRHLCYPTPFGKIEYVSTPYRLTFDGQLASVVGERIFIVKQTPQVGVEVANLMGNGEYVDSYGGFENTTAITNLSVSGENKLILACQSNGDLPHNAVYVLDVETRRQLFTIHAKTAFDVVMNDEQNSLIASTCTMTQVFDTRQQMATVFTTESDTTTRIIALVHDYKLILSESGGIITNVYDLRMGDRNCCYMHGFCMTWDKYKDLLCGVHCSEASAMVYDLQTEHPFVVSFVE